MQMRIATYNVHRCVGRDGVQAPQRITEILRSIKADVVALQEVAFDDSVPRNVLADLSHCLDAAVFAGPTLKKRKG
jgi:endonuclease/exonuclease/phosphatase family metal-dependent hydrolase